MTGTPLDQGKPPEPSSGTALARRRPRSDITPLSFAQRRVWFLHRLGGSTPVHNVPLAIRLSGKLDTQALGTALQDVLSRHEALRTVFPEEDGRPYQEVMDGHAAHVALPIAEVGEAGLTEALAAATRHGFDLSRELPVRAQLFAISRDEHVLLVVTHQIAIDSWSLDPLGQDLGTAYTARREGLKPAWTPLPVRYADYTSRQRELLADVGNRDSAISGQLAYWKSALAGLPTELPLPADHARLAAPGHRSGSVPIELSAELHERLLDVAGQGRATLFMVIQAGLAAFLTCLGAGTDIPIGSSIAGRTSKGLTEVVGLLSNTLVLRVDTSGHPGFQELVDRVRAVDLEAYARQELPFEYLVEVASPDRSMARHPLFQVMLSLEDGVADAPFFADLKSELVPVDLDVTEVDLSCSLTARHHADRSPAGVSGVLGYSADLFERDTAEMIAARLVRLLTAAVDDPGLPIGQIALLSSQERVRLLGTGTGHAAEICPVGVAELFAAQAARTPDAVALLVGDSALTYRALDVRAGQLARYLRLRGVGLDRLVGLFVERGAEMVIGMLGILAAGGAYVPVDPRYPAERVVFMLEDSAVTLVLTQDQLQDRIPVGCREVVSLSVGLGTHDQPGGVRLPRAHPVTVAYVSYTSGSTGTPKGVATTHRNIVNLISDRCWADGNHERVLFHSPYSFDAATYELWVPLLTGGEVVMITEDRADACDLEHLISEKEVTAAYFTTALFEVMSQEAMGGLAHLREIWTGGDVLSAVALQDVLDACTRTTVMHAYGPTETTVFCSFQPFGLSRRRVGALTLGQPMENVRMYVLDESLRLALPEVLGELYVAGAGLARGYLRQPGLTAMRFVADPFGEPGSQMYRTGDLARWSAAGEIEFAGRSDEQVKVRGFRVEPGEVEAVLGRHPLAGQVAVVAREDRAGDKRLIGYVVPTAEGAFDVGDLRAFARKSLPEYLIPSAFVMVDCLPLTPNGKLDRRALSAPSMTGLETLRTYVAPRTRAEKEVARIWSDLLGTEQVGIHDNFFALGGDSFLAVRLVSRLRSLFGAEIPVHAIFRSQTIADLTDELRTAVAGSFMTARTATGH